MQGLSSQPPKDLNSLLVEIRVPEDIETSPWAKSFREYLSSLNQPEKEAMFDFVLVCNVLRVKESEVKQSLERKITQLKSVQFGKQWSKISKTHESYAYDEREMRQKIIIGDTKLDYYRFRHLRDTNYLKLVPGREGFVGEYLWSNEGLSQIIEFSMSHTEGYTRYVMQVPFVQH